MNRKCILYIIILLFVSVPLRAQFYNTGQDPASLKWKQLNTTHFKFIFPDDYEKEARRTARIFEESYNFTGGRYGEAEIRKFPVIIHNHSVESNGYVAWAPKRVELFPSPAQNSIPLFHTYQLALHELIHVSQMQSLRQGLSAPMEIIFGEQYPGALSIFTPFWFLEGEAVVAESVFSYSGRGRQPDFEKRLKALLLDNKQKYSYDKLINASYQSYTPDHYQFGYQMAAFTRSKYGEDVFPGALANISRRPFTLNPFNITLKKETGHSKKELFDSTMEYLKNNWASEDALIQKSEFTYYDRRDNRDYINYHSPKIIGTDSIIAIKTSLDKSPSFVLITNSGATEKKVFTPGFIWPYRFSVSGSVITWAENVSDPRWDNRDYSNIKTLDLESGTLNFLTRRSRLFSPALSPDGSLIAISESSESYNNSIVIIDSQTGTRLKSIATPANVMMVNPVWADNNKQLAFISSGEKGEGIMIFNNETNTFETRIKEGNSDLQSVALRNDSLFYIASYSGINNVYCLAPSGIISRLTSSRFGLSDISLSGSQLLFSDYTSTGNRIGTFHILNEYSQWDTTKDKSLLLIKDIDGSDKLPYYTDYLSDDYVVSPYRKWKHLFNFHSWMPFYADINNISFDNIGVSPGATLMSQNHLSTLTSTIAYEYINSEHLFHTGLIWEGQYPAVQLDLTYGGVPEIALDADSLYFPSSVNTGLKASALIYLPLRFNTGKFYQTFYPSLRFNYRNNYIYEESTGVFDYGQLFTTGRIYFSNLHRMAYRDIWPRWGQILDISGTFVPGDKTIYGPQKNLRATLYAPGLFSSHGIKLMYQKEKQEFRDYIQYNRISFPRGYNNIVSSDLVSASADYTLPLVYPDINIGSLVYLNRIRAAFFYDYSVGSGNYHIEEHTLVEEKEVFNSFGAELLADFYLLRMPFRFSSGIQSAWIPETKEPYFKFVFNIDIFGYVIGKEPVQAY